MTTDRRVGARRVLPRRPPSEERAWMGTASGHRFYPLDPRARDVRIEDVARGLAMTCRYGGQVKRFYSVAEHCVHVSRFVDPEYAREALMHDSAEAYIGDLIRPIKHQPEMAEFRRAEAAIERCVFQAFSIEPTPESRAAVKSIDDRILVDEIQRLSANPSLYLDTAPLRYLQPLGLILECWDHSEAERQYLERYRRLFG